MTTALDTLIIFVLDQSGSMLSVRQPTIDGFNDFLHEQQDFADADAWLSLTLFSTAFDARYVAEPIRKVSDLGAGDNTYMPAGGTALLDAIGASIRGAEGWIDKTGFAGKVLCVILTDGAENSSRQWHLRQPLDEADEWDIAGLIKSKQAKDAWEFMFLGSGGSAWLENNFGHVVAAKRFAGYVHDADATKRSYAGVSRMSTALRRGKDVSF